MCRLLGLTKTKSSALHPEGNGQVERFNRTLGEMLAIYCDDNPHDWDNHLPYILAAYRSAKHSSTKMSPNMLLFGRENALPLHVVVGDPNREDTVPDPDSYVDQLRHLLLRVYALVRTNIDHSTAIQKRCYDHRAKRPEFREGQPVWLYNPQRRRGISPKLTAPWQKGYIIMKRLDDITFRIQSGPNARAMVVHANRLMPYEGRDPPQWYRNPVPIAR